ncbi:flagellar biosynthesis anti-sigma factor FlgM [Nitrosomonas sp. Is37]|uniref:flagellar biosynthesis anti-sigma factor FlgM n=1 Tax=Nitrosomonas sp. Is37 TaxID=3080535 RepID=UPI00294ADBBA|nr:flagellar biosynthesis anti-sigma factor FlgM [Nitrosomonas sp. Is37]MDV6343617.1 flagellar biosynthesis anti-sigma factor FlgM [Nitrosomonas sp. Is37]
MKIDNTNPTQAISINSDEQKYNDKTTSTKSPYFSQSKNNLRIDSSFILSHSIESNNEIVDAAKVAKIRQAIIEGRFKVNSEAVADRLLETVKELIQSKKDNT